MMDFLDILVRYGWLAAIATNLLLGWVGWSLRKQFVTRAEAEERFKAQDAKIEAAAKAAADAERDVSSRLTRIEERQSAAPSHKDLTRIHERLDRIADVTGRLEGSLAPLHRLTDLLTQAQLDRERTAR